MSRHRQAVGLAALFITVVLAACVSCDDPAQPPEPDLSGEDAWFWVGTYENPGSGTLGRLTLKLDRSGEDLNGELTVEETHLGYLRVYELSGITDGNTFYLGMSGKQSADITQFQVTAIDSGAAGLVGYFSIQAVGGPFRARPVLRRKLEVVATQEISLYEYLSSLVADSLGVLVSGLDNWYFLDPTNGAVLDSFRVGNSPWQNLIANTCTWDGELYYGGISRSDKTVYTELVAFDAEGMIMSRTPLSHRTSGLAFGDGDFWSLERDATALHRVDRAGNDLESHPLESPDLINLTYHEGRLISRGLRGNHFAELALDGTLAAVYEYREGIDLVDPRGITSTPQGKIFCLGKAEQFHRIL